MATVKKIICPKCATYMEESPDGALDCPKCKLSIGAKRAKQIQERMPHKLRYDMVEVG